MPGLQVHFEVLNQLNTPTLYADTLANRPAAQIVGRIFFRTDTPFGVYRDTGSAWDLVANLDTNSGGTVTNVSALTLGTTGTDLSSTVLNGTTTPVITLNVPTASASNRGALSSADWSTFNAKFTLPSLTLGSVLFSNGTTIAQNNANFFWDNTNNRLGIGNASPGVTLDIHGAGVIVHINGTTTNNAFQTFQNAGTGKWRLGNNYSAATNYFSIFDIANSVESFKLESGATNILTINASTTNQGNIKIQKSGANPRLEIQQDTASATNKSEMVLLAPVGFSAISKYTASTTAFKIISANDLGIYNYLSSGDIAILNDFATGKIKFAAGSSSTAQTTITAAGRLLIGTTTEGTDILSINGSTLHSGNVTMADAINFIFNTTTGTKIATATTQKIGFWNVAPIVQPTTAVASATFVVNAGTAVNTLSTFDGYKIDQIVKALRNLGILA